MTDCWPDKRLESALVSSVERRVRQMEIKYRWHRPCPGPVQAFRGAHPLSSDHERRL